MKTLLSTLIIFLWLSISVVAQMVNQVNSSGEKEGSWVKYFDNNRVKYEGQFHLGKPIGKFTYYYKEGGVKAVSDFSDDGIVVKNITYYKNGLLMAEGEFVNQKKNGLWKYYLKQKNNPLISTETYLNGELDGESVTYYPETGNRTEVVSYKNGKKDGELLKYFPDGTLMTKSYYKDGLPDGSFVHYHIDGKIQIEGNYSKGIQIGEWKYFDDKGNLVDEEAFKKQEEVRDIE